eukprot:scaffold149_cov315-Pinguiococcus_pyrenoidosus.AAC.143
MRSSDQWSARWIRSVAIALVAASLAAGFCPSPKAVRTDGLALLAKRPKKRAEKPSAAPSEGDVLAGVAEDHNFEQFFWDEDSCDRLYRIAKDFEKPLFLCCPSLAHRADRAGQDHVLLDRDSRFKFLPKYRRFSIEEPYILPKRCAGYDAIFVDPPFANVTPKQVGSSTISLLVLEANGNERRSGSG